MRNPKFYVSDKRAMEENQCWYYATANGIKMLQIYKTFEMFDNWQFSLNQQPDFFDPYTTSVETHLLFFIQM